MYKDCFFENINIKKAKTCLYFFRESCWNTYCKYGPELTEDGECNGMLTEEMLTNEQAQKRKTAERLLKRS